MLITQKDNNMIENENISKEDETLSTRTANVIRLCVLILFRENYHPHECRELATLGQVSIPFRETMNRIG